MFLIFIVKHLMYFLLFFSVTLTGVLTVKTDLIFWVTLLEYTLEYFYCDCKEILNTCELDVWNILYTNRKWWIADEYVMCWMLKFSFMKSILTKDSRISSILRILLRKIIPFFAIIFKYFYCWFYFGMILNKIIKAT